jgi:hypothetical protein
MPASHGEQIVVERVGAQVFVVNKDHGAWIDEVGTVQSPVYAPLRRGVIAAGSRLERSAR